MTKFSLGQRVEAPTAGYYNLVVYEVLGETSYTCILPNGVRMVFSEHELRAEGSTDMTSTAIKPGLTITCTITMDEDGNIEYT